MTPVKSQGDRDACAQFAVAALLEAELKRAYGRDVDLSEEFLIFSERSAANQPGEETSIASVLHSVLRNGLLLEQDWAYQPSWFSRGLPGAAFERSPADAPPRCFSHDAPPPEVMARRRMARMKPRVVAHELLVTTLAEGHPLIAALRQPHLESEDEPPPGWPISGEMFFDEALAAKYPECPLHFVLLTGYDLERRVFMFKNSWGTGWGRQGYGTVSFDVVDEHRIPCFLVRGIELDPVADEMRYAPSATSLSVTAREAEGALEIEVRGRVQDAAGRLILVASQLMKQTRDAAASSPDAELREVALPEAECEPFRAFTRGQRGPFRGPSAAWFQLPGEGQDAWEWGQSAPLRLALPAELMQAPLVAALLQSTTERPVLRTRISVHTDDVGYRTLCTVDTPLR